MFSPSSNLKYVFKKNVCSIFCQIKTVTYIFLFWIIDSRNVWRLHPRSWRLQGMICPLSTLAHTYHVCLPFWFNLLWVILKTMWVFFDSLNDSHVKPCTARTWTCFFPIVYIWLTMYICNVGMTPIYM